jgi:hypothetical protein
VIKLHVPLWELLWRGTVLYLVARFMIRGHVFKRRLRHDAIAGSAATPREDARAPVGSASEQ